jgi:hypothetical protein
MNKIFIYRSCPKYWTVSVEMGEVRLASSIGKFVAKISGVTGRVGDDGMSVTTIDIAMTYINRMYQSKVTCKNDHK